LFELDHIDLYRSEKNTKIEKYVISSTYYFTYISRRDRANNADATQKEHTSTLGPIKIVTLFKPIDIRTF